MPTIILGNAAYTTLQQLQETTTQSPAIDTPFAQDLLAEFEEFTLMAWLDDFQGTTETIKSDRLEGLHFHRHELDRPRLLQDIYNAINLKEQ